MNQHRRLGRRQVLYRSRDVCRWPDAITDPSNDNLDRMTAKLVSTPTLGRALRFWREHYVADRERGSWSSAVWDLSPLSFARTADRDHDRVVAPVLQMHQLRVRVVRCALVRRGRRSHRRAIAVDLCRAAALITPRRHDIRRVSGLRHTGAGAHAHHDVVSLLPVPCLWAFMVRGEARSATGGKRVAMHCGPYSEAPSRSSSDAALRWAGERHVEQHRFRQFVKIISAGLRTEGSSRDLARPVQSRGRLATALDSCVPTNRAWEDLRCRQRRAPMPASPRPSSVRDAGSGHDTRLIV